MSERSPTSDALKSLKKQLRDRTGEQKIFRLVVSVKEDEEKKDKPEEETEE
jgi:hypothetical protein